MKHYLYQTDKLEILINEKERPDRSNYLRSEGEHSSASFEYETDLKEWLSSCERYHLAPGEEAKFHVRLGKDAIFPTKSEWKEGVLIPAENVKITEVACSNCDKCLQYNNCEDAISYAYFVEPEPAKNYPHCKTCGDWYGIDINHRCFKCLGDNFHWKVESITEDHWPSVTDLVFKAINNISLDGRGGTCIVIERQFKELAS